MQHGFLSRDFEVGINVSCEESTVSPRMGLIFHTDQFSGTVEQIVRCLCAFLDNI